MPGRLTAKWAIRRAQQAVCTVIAGRAVGRPLHPAPPRPASLDIGPQPSNPRTIPSVRFRLCTNAALPPVPPPLPALQGSYELVQAQQELESRAAQHWRQRRAATGARAFEGLRCHVAAALDPPFKRADIV